MNYCYIQYFLHIIKYIYNCIIYLKNKIRYKNNSPKIDTLQINTQKNMWEAPGYNIVIHPLNLEHIN